MRVNVYAEDLNIFVEWRGKESGGKKFDGVSFYMDAGDNPANAVTFWMRQGSRDPEKLKYALSSAVELINQALRDRESHHVPE